MSKTMKSCDGDIDICSTDMPSLRDKIDKVVRAYCEDAECELCDMCGSPNCEAYGIADIAVEELMNEIMEIIEND